MADRKKIKEILLSIIHLPNAPDIAGVGGEQLITTYVDVLGHWPDDLIDMAVLHYLSTETFFPTPGALNNKILDMQLIAMGVPTAGEAWSQVVGALHYVDTVLCGEGKKLRDEAHERIGGEYMVAISSYGAHRNACTICRQGGLQEVYSHPVVEETVRLLGGRDAVMTDNPAADRKQFVDAYRERVALEGRKAIMPPEVSKYLASNPAGQLMSGLTRKLEVK